MISVSKGSKNIERPVRVYRILSENKRLRPRPALALPDRPSIAVLPFQNMSGDPEQDYFADGVVEELITALSRFRQLFVIARNSSFTYKDRAADVKEVWGRGAGIARDDRRLAKTRESRDELFHNAIGKVVLFWVQPLVFWKGNTAIDGRSGRASAGRGLVALFSDRMRYTRTGRSMFLSLTDIIKGEV